MSEEKSKNPHQARPKKAPLNEKKKRQPLAPGEKDERPDGDWSYRVDHEKLRMKENPKFDRYYRDLQKIGGTTPEEWSAFMETMRTPLPTTIWINDTDPMAAQVSAHFASLGSDVASPIPWYPIRGMAWRINVDKVRFRRDPAIKPLRRYLVTQTASGTISRQEEVSMIPTFLLDIQPEDKCLDMCASPGSKTAQMLVALGRHKQRGDGVLPFDYLSGGCVIANELDPKRANMLVYQVKRMRSLFPFALFTNHDARYMHTPRMPDGNEVQFDKILCDVVCSGDGTLRKAPHMVGQWKPSQGINLQPLQIQIALRGCHMLKVGGRMVYSTCSMNPIENEAVVTQLVMRTNGAMKLVDVRSTLLPNLECDPGLTSWTVVDTSGELCTEPGAKAHPACFPVNPAPHGLDLTKCMRLMPKHCNGGGFFVAVLEKAAPFAISAQEIAEQDAELEAKEVEKERQARCRRAGKKSERPPSEESIDDKEKKVSRAPRYFPGPPDVETCMNGFYGSKAIPADHLVVRCDSVAEEVKAQKAVPHSQLYFTSTTVRDLVMQRDPRCTIVSAGVRAFVYESYLGNEWRITAEAAPIFSPVMQSSLRLLNISLEDAMPMIQSRPLKDVLIDDISRSDLQEQVKALSVGPVLFNIHGIHGNVACAGFRARTRIQIFVDNEDMVGLKNRLGMEIDASEVEEAEKLAE